MSVAIANYKLKSVFVRLRDWSYLGTDLILGHYLFLELRSRKTVRYSEQIMSADKYSRIFSPQMEAIVYLVYTTQVNSAFRGLWLVTSEVISKYFSPPSSSRERNLNFRPLVTHKITFRSANYSACVVYTKSFIRLTEWWIYTSTSVNDCQISSFQMGLLFIYSSINFQNYASLRKIWRIINTSLGRKYARTSVLRHYRYVFQSLNTGTPRPIGLNPERRKASPA